MNGLIPATLQAATCCYCAFVERADVARAVFGTLATGSSMKALITVPRPTRTITVRAARLLSPPRESMLTCLGNGVNIP